MCWFSNQIVRVTRLRSFRCSGTRCKSLATPIRNFVISWPPVVATPGPKEVVPLLAPPVRLLLLPPPETGVRRVWRGLSNLTAFLRILRSTPKTVQDPMKCKRRSFIVPIKPASMTASDAPFEVRIIRHKQSAAALTTLVSRQYMDKRDINAPATPFSRVKACCAKGLFVQARTMRRAHKVAARPPFGEVEKPRRCLEIILIPPSRRTKVIA
mmetsp:Transcript_24210/g.43360  ORF Transcript_24210/g.43360 Transcript_24210/m.43360 type:complete len:212 (-) Transcript_24210:353-988(-)